MFGKKSCWNYLKILRAKFFKRFNHLIGFTSLHTHTVLHHYLPPLMSFSVKSSKKSSLFWFFLCRKYSSTKTTGCSSFLRKILDISLFLVSIILHSLLSTIPSCLLLPKKLWLSIKALLLLLTKSPYARKFCFSVCFLSFFRFFRFCFLAYWDHYSKFAGFDSLRSSKMY